jgi:hypothetical protein
VLSARFGSLRQLDRLLGTVSPKMALQGRARRPGDPVVHVTIEQHNIDKYNIETHIASVEERLKTAIRMQSLQLEALETRVRIIEQSCHDTAVRIDSMRIQQAAPVQIVMAGAGDSDVNMRSRLAALDSDLIQLRQNIRQIEDRCDELRRRLSSTQDDAGRQQATLHDYGGRTSHEQMLALTDRAMRSLVLAPVVPQAINARMNQIALLNPIRVPRFDALPDTGAAIRQIIESFRPTMQALAPPGPRADYPGPAGELQEPSSDYAEEGFDA